MEVNPTPHERAHTRWHLHRPHPRNWGRFWGCMGVLGVCLILWSVFLLAFYELILLLEQFSR